MNPLRPPGDHTFDSEESTASGDAAFDRDPGVVTWGGLVRFLRRNLWVLLGCSLGLAVLAVVALASFQPLRYEAVATVIVAPQRFRSELKPAILPVQGYQLLLESNAVVAEANRRLREQGVLKDRGALRLGSDLKSRIFVSRRAEETTLAPILEVVANAATSEAAAAVANTWSEVFLERASTIQEEGVTPLVTLLEDEYQEERLRLSSLLEEQSRVVEKYQIRLDELSLAWDHKLVDARKRTEQLVAQHHGETRSVMERFAAERGLDVGVTEVERSEGGAELPEDLESKLLQILSLRIELAQTPRVLVLEKAMSDDALWQATVFESDARALETGVSHNLVTEEANPVYDQLALRLSAVQTDLDAVSPRERRQVQRFTAGLEKLQMERTTRMTHLLSERALLLRELERQRARELQAVHRERRIELERIEADIAHQRVLFGKLAENRSEAGLAEAEQVLREVRLGTPAVPPAQPEPRRLVLAGLVAAFVGGMLGLLFCVVREVEPEGRPRPTSG